MIVIIALALISGPVHAEDKDREALKRMQRNIAKLQSDNAALQRDKDELTSKMDAADKELTDLRKVKVRAEVLGRQVKKLTDENTDLKSQLDLTQKTLGDTTKQCQEDHRRAELVMGNLKTTLAMEQTDRRTCQANNKKLRDIGHEILDRYQIKGIFEGVLQREPFTQLKSVEMENLVQDYGEKIDDLSVKDH